MSTGTAEERAHYRQFRKLLMSNGFLMMQESVYCRLLITPTAERAVIEILKKTGRPRAWFRADGDGKAICPHGVPGGRKPERSCSEGRKVDRLMRLVHPELENALETDNGCYNSLGIEEMRFMTRFLQDIHDQIQGLDGQAVLSADNAPLPFPKWAAVLDTFVPFDLNRKPLISKIVSALESRAGAAERFEETADIMRRAEIWLDALTFDFPCDIVFSGISAGALIKASSPEIRGEEQPMAGRVADYMELIGEFDRPRLYITVNINMRSFVADDEMERFAQTVIGHGYHVIGLESTARPLLSVEKRVLADNDLCEIS